MAEPKRYFWLKLQDGFFGSKRIKKLRRMAGGDTFVIIYLKMQLKSIKNNGVLEFTGLEQDFAEELALDLDEEVDDVRMTLTYLLNTGLIETSDNVNFLLPYAVDNTGSECASTQRSRECRARQRESVALQQERNATATLPQQTCNVEIEKEKEKEIEKEIESYIEKEIEDCKGKEDATASDRPTDSSLPDFKSLIISCLKRNTEEGKKWANYYYEVSQRYGVQIDIAAIKQEVMGVG